MTTLYHTSPAEITSISKSGTFGDVLFFSSDIYYMSAIASHIYSIDLSDDQVIDAACLESEAAVQEIMRYTECDEDTAFELLTASISEYDVECDDASELGFYLQQIRAETAREMGFVACKDQDEQGAVYMISMSGRLDMLTLTKD